MQIDLYLRAQMDGDFGVPDAELTGEALKARIREHLSPGVVALVRGINPAEMGAHVAYHATFEAFAGEGREMAQLQEAALRTDLINARADAARLAGALDALLGATQRRAQPADPEQGRAMHRARMVLATYGDLLTFQAAERDAKAVQEKQRADL